MLDAAAVCARANGTGNALLVDAAETRQSKSAAVELVTERVETDTGLHSNEAGHMINRDDLVEVVQVDEPRRSAGDVGWRVTTAGGGNTAPGMTGQADDLLNFLDRFRLDVKLGQACKGAGPGPVDMSSLCPERNAAIAEAGELNDLAHVGREGGERRVALGRHLEWLGFPK